MRTVGADISSTPLARSLLGSMLGTAVGDALGLASEGLKPRRQDDYPGGIREMIRRGGDADTTAVIVGGIIGARVGREGIPAPLLAKLVDWPRSPGMIERVAIRLARAREAQTPMRAVRCAIWAAPLRNLIFLVIVLAHGFRRLLPPY